MSKIGKLECRLFIDYNMDNNIIIEGFDPSPFNLKDYVSTHELKYVEKYLNDGILLSPARVFSSSNELANVYTFIKHFDPALAHVCMLSYKYTLHPIYGAGVSRINKFNEFTVGGYDQNFRSRRLVLDPMLKVELDWYINSFGVEELFFVQSKQGFATEYNQRWDAIAQRMTTAGLDCAGITFASFYFTRLSEVITHEMDVYYVSKLLDIPSLTITNLLLLSTGIHLNWSILMETYSPPNPFLDE